MRWNNHGVLAVIRIVSVGIILCLVFLFAHKHNVSSSRRVFSTKMRLSKGQGIKSVGIDYENFAIDVLDVSRSELSDKKLFEFLSRSAIGRVNTLKISSEQSIDIDELRMRIEIGNVVSSDKKMSQEKRGVKADLK